MNRAAGRPGQIGLVGVVCALRQEAAALTHRPLKTQTPLAVNQCLALIISGMGVRNAEHMAQELARQPLRCLISFGTAGGLAKALRAGDICIPAQVKDAAGHETRIDNGYRARLLASLEKARQAVHTGPLLSTDNVITSRTAKQQQHERHQCDLVDMEAAAVLRVAAAHRIPALAVKCIVDVADVGLPAAVLRSTGSCGDVNILRLAAGLLQRPADLTKLISLAFAYKKAQGALRLLGRHISAL